MNQTINHKDRSEEFCWTSPGKHEQSNSETARFSTRWRVRLLPVLSAAVTEARHSQSINKAARELLGAVFGEAYLLFWHLESISNLKRGLRQLQLFCLHLCYCKGSFQCPGYMYWKLSNSSAMRGFSKWTLEASSDWHPAPPQQRWVPNTQLPTARAPSLPQERPSKPQNPGSIIISF